jgi:hypothetical protein
MLKVTDQWTTRDGHWYNSGQRYDIDQVHVDKYPASMISQAGAATHIMVKAPIGSKVEFVNRYDNQVYKTVTVPPSDGFVDMEMQHSSGYVPERGETGPWTVRVNGTKVAEGIGLPESWHVSTWLIVEDIDGTEVPENGGPEVPPTEPGEKTITVISIKIAYSDGTTETIVRP